MLAFNNVRHENITLHLLPSQLGHTFGAFSFDFNLFSFQKSTQEQREVIKDLFDQLSKLQTTILGEVSTFYSLCFYVLSIIVCYLLTSTPRTAGMEITFL